MKKLKGLLLGTVIGAQTSSSNAETMIHLNEINRIGLQPEVVREHFRITAGINLNWNEILQVQSNEEGSEINFNTLDGISIIVPVYNALGCPNKGPVDAQTD